MPHAPVRSPERPDWKLHILRSLFTKVRVLSLAAALTIAPAVAVAAAPAADAATQPARLTALAYAKHHLGDRYQYGAAGPNAFDCSGLTMQAYAAARTSIGGHSATAQYRTARARHQLRSRFHAYPGDLLFYGTTSDVYHVAIWAGGNWMIEAAHDGVPVRLVPLRRADLLSQVGNP